MSSPIGHSLAGLAVARLSSERLGRRLIFPIILGVFMANAPDFDFVPGLLINRPALFHGEVLHSIGFALILSFAVAAVLRLKGYPFRPTFYLGFAAYTTHLFLDLLRPDGRPPYGIPLLWPLSDAYFLSPWPLFMSIHHAGSTSETTAEFIRGVLDRRNLLAIGLEVVILSPVVFLVHRLKSRTAPRTKEANVRGMLEKGKI